MTFLLLGIVVVLIIVVVVQYNRLVSLKHGVDNAFSDIDVQMKNRFDLVENLVNTVKGATSHENETLVQITQARTSFLNAGDDVAKKMEADGQITSALKSLFAVSENYPELQANQNFLELQRELSSLEKNVASSRRFLNASVKEYAIACDTFPTNLVANIFDFRQDHKYFAVTTEEEKVVPTVKF